jgi:hypothetical protein
MENINLPPTRLDVVAQTMNLSKRIAEECEEQKAIVHYDLAIAKLALQIRFSKSPHYDDVFVCFSPFLILLAYLTSLGHLLNGSGGAAILTETDLLMFRQVDP